MPLDEQRRIVANALSFLGRANITGAEAPALMEVIGLLRQLQGAEIALMEAGRPAGG